MSKVNRILEEITEQLYRYSQFLETLDANDINATAKASLINIRNLAISIVNSCNNLIAKKNGLTR